MGSTAEESGSHNLSDLTDRKWLSLNRFGVLIGKSYPVVLKMVNKGQVKAIRVGGRWRIYEEEVRRFLQEGNRDPSGE